MIVVSRQPPRTALEALARRRFPLTGWPWRALGHLLTTPPVALAAAVSLGVLALPWLYLLAQGTDIRRLPIVGVAVAVLLGAVLLGGLGPLVALPLAELERIRLRLVDSRPITSGHRAAPALLGWHWLRTRYTEPATWWELGYALLLATVAPVFCAAVGALALLVGVLLAGPLLVATVDGPVSVGLGAVDTVPEALRYALLGLVLLPVLPYAVGLVAGAHGALGRAMLQGGTDARLRTELIEVTRSRARLVDAFEAERRRIERDLHDGAQQRLVSLTLQLGLARLELPPDTPGAQAVIDAHEQAKALMTELRELIRGIHPTVLTDLGLPAALHELADRSPLPVRVDAELPGRLPPAIEGTAYFVVAEALANVGKHSGATTATVTVRQRDGLLTVQVQDDGVGGAEPARGSGLTGLADRAAVAGGRMFLSSPPGGPTVIRVELPCPPNHA